MALMTALPVPSGGGAGAGGALGGGTVGGGGSDPGGAPPIGVVVFRSGVGAVGVEVLDLEPQAAIHVANSTTVVERVKLRLDMERAGSRRPK